MSRRCLRIAVVFVAASSLACVSQPSGKTKEKDPDQSTTPAATKPVEAKKLKLVPGPRPALYEVKRALSRIYQDALDLPARAEYVAGDFNGDGSQDLAVIAMPRRNVLAKLNDNLANWVIQSRNQNPAMRPTIQPGDRLVAIIHGHESSGWRNPEAMQSYLIREAAGVRLRAGQVKLSGIPENLRPAMFGGGDVIHQDLDGEPGFLYWDGGRYRWFSEPDTAKLRAGTTDR